MCLKLHHPEPQSPAVALLIQVCPSMTSSSVSAMTKTETSTRSEEKNQLKPTLNHQKTAPKIQLCVCWLLPQQNNGIPGVSKDGTASCVPWGQELVRGQPKVCQGTSRAALSLCQGSKEPGMAPQGWGLSPAGATGCCVVLPRARPLQSLLRNLGEKRVFLSCSYGNERLDIERGCRG